MSDHVVPVRTYLAVFTALMVFTVLTVVASRYHIGHWNTPLAMAIAGTKAVLVLLFFMHVKYNNRLIQLVVASGFFFLVLLFGITLFDYASRGASNPRTNPHARPDGVPGTTGALHLAGE